jgi:hypothetical protein
MARGTTVLQALDPADLADRIRNIRSLITIADQQIDRAKTDLGVARVGLADLEQQLLTVGVRK